MSLRVWLPLTKDLRNQGLDDIPSFQLISGNSFITGGKIGEKAFNITKQQRILSNTSCMTGKKQMSYAFWVKVNIVWTTQWLDGIAWYSTDGTSAYYSRQEFYNNCTKVGTWFKGSPNSLSDYDFNPEKWTHIAATFNYNTGEAKFYLNGELKGTSNSLSTSDYCRGDFYIGDTGLDILENDVRIYDHALSPMEVKQISQGLILHYPLNNNGWGNKNLLTQTQSEMINWTNINTDCVSISSDNYKNTFYLIKGVSGKWENVYSPAISVEANKEYTISCLYKVYDNYNFTSSYGDFGLTVMKAVPTNANPISNTIARAGFKNVSGGFWKAQATFTPTVTTIYLNMCGGSIVDGQTNKKFDVNYIKLEEGSIATPWCPNSSDVLATTMGLNDNVEYDVSGYCNNGTRTGTFSWTSDTPKYSVSTAFEKGIISIPNSFVTTVDPIFSVSLWFKLKSGITYTAYTDLISFSSSSYSNQPFRLELCGTPVGKTIMWFRGPSGQTGGFAVKLDISTDEWYHTALVSEGNKQYSYYVNGEKLGTYNGSANSWTPTGNVFLGENINGVFYESDFRIYATALSADDVKSLYQNSAYIDNQGNIYGAVYEEV